MLKRMYHMLALLAFINLFAVAGLVGYLVATGRLDGTRMRQIGIVLRGEFPEPPPPSTQPAAPEEAPIRSRAEIAAIQAQQKYWALVAERHEREMSDRKSVNQNIRLEVDRELEEIARREKRFEEEKKKVLEQAGQSGFTQALEMYSSMNPKLAKDVLSTRKDADVIQLFLQMDPMKRRKIIDACKTPEERAWVGRILESVQKLNDELSRREGSGGS
mgnify:CR=1 FL=1